ncbi:hypothetical protein ACHAQA_005892 [Verticillium albo-atrum]
MTATTTHVHAETYTNVPDGLIDRLVPHLPYSLSLVRRLQFTTASPTGKTPNARIIVASDNQLSNGHHDTGSGTNHFTVSYFDPSRGPETQTWIYSTLEDAHARDASIVLTSDEVALCEKQILAVVSEIKRVAREYDQVEPLAYPRQVLVGTFNHAVRAVLRKNNLSLTHRHDYEKFIFRFDQLPSTDVVLPDGLSFEPTTLEDCHIVKSRTDIPRKVTTLFTLPSMTIKQADGTPVAWAFLGPDGSMCSLHCEEQHRRKGLARAVAAKVIRERTRLYGGEPWSSSEVAPTNVSSQAMCKSLNGEIKWDVDLGKDAPVTEEGTGVVEAGSLADESAQKGGEFAENRDAEPSSTTESKSSVDSSSDKVSSGSGKTSQSTSSNNASSGAAKSSGTNASSGATKSSGTNTSSGNQTSGNTSSNTSNSKTTSQSTSSSKPTDADSFAGTAPTYVDNNFIRDTAGPHGKNLHEGIDYKNTKDGLKEALKAPVGSENDPGRAAEQQFLQSQARVGRDAGPKEYEVGSKTTFDNLEEKQA